MTASSLSNTAATTATMLLLIKCWPCCGPGNPVQGSAWGAQHGTRTAPRRRQPQQLELHEIPTLKPECWSALTVEGRPNLDAVDVEAEVQLPNIAARVAKGVRVLLGQQVLQHPAFAHQPEQVVVAPAVRGGEQLV